MLNLPNGMLILTLVSTTIIVSTILLYLLVSLDLIQVQITINSNGDLTKISDPIPANKPIGVSLDFRSKNRACISMV